MKIIALCFVLLLFAAFLFVVFSWVKAFGNGMQSDEIAEK